MKKGVLISVMVMFRGMLVVRIVCGRLLVSRVRFVLFSMVKGRISW